METEDLIKLPASSDSEHGENDNTCESGSEAINSESLPLNSEVTEEIHGEDPGAILGVLDENMDALMEDDFESGPNINAAAPPVGLEITDSVADVEKVVSVSSVHHGNGFLPVQSEINVRNLKKNEVFSSKREVDANSAISGVKRPRVAVDEQQPSVHVVYSSLPRESKQKLEKLLEQWSQWHSQWSSSSDDSNVVLESGEETYFPALRVGGDKPSSITFWVDNQTKMQSSKEFRQLDSTSVPLYDRGYSSALTSTDASGLDGRAEKLDTSRCFNCGSYSHALKDCSKPRDHAAVNNARKQHKVKRNQHPNSRNSTRYYQTSRGGKYDGLTPGVLDGETRKALGLGELDPPPWLNRMREIGYPPGYLDADTEDQPSGITIFGDDTSKDESEEGEILDASFVEPSRKMTVEFPGINAPVPENADERLWAPNSSSSNPSRHNADERLWAPNSSSSNPSRYSSHQRYNQPSETSSRGYYSEQRWSRDWDDEGPPGCEPGTSPSLSNHFHRYGDSDSGYRPLSPRASPSTPWSSSYARSLSDRGRRSPLHHDGSPTYGYYGSYASPR